MLFRSNSVGINGAKLNSFLKENLYETQIKEIDPDLVVFDLIANDLETGEFNYDQVEKDLKSCIAKIKASNSEASIIVVGMQDCYIEGRDVINAGLYSSYLKKFAAFNNVAFYDYYPVSGGVRSMKKWSKNGLSAKDM